MTLSKNLKLDISRHNSQYAPIEVRTFTKAHDRFLIIDNDVYLIGASIKDLGKKWFGFTLMENTNADELSTKCEETAAAAENGTAGMSLEEIDEEIRQVRAGLQV